MNEISPEQLLSQIRSLGRDLQTTGPIESAPTTDFSDMLKTSLNAVNETQQKARELKVGFESTEIATGTEVQALTSVLLRVGVAPLRHWTP